MRYKALIFDCDGTLVDSERLALEVIVEMALEHGAIIDIEDAMQRFRGTRLAECIAHIETLSGTPVPDHFTAQYRARMAERFRSHLKAIPGAQELLKDIIVPIAVASNGPREKMELTLSITGLLSYFDGRIFSAYEIGHWKPKPELFLHAARAMNVQPHECAVIEDSNSGIEAAIAAGMHVFVLNNEHIDVRVYAGGNGSVTVVDSLGQLAPLLKQA